MITGQNTKLSVDLLLHQLHVFRSCDLPKYDVWVDSGYCLDAPVLLAAGSHYRDEFGTSPDDDWIPMPTLVNRDG